MTYTVVGCPSCTHYFIVHDHPERTTCRRCRSSHQFKKLKEFHTTDNLDEARDARSQLLASNHPELTSPTFTSAELDVDDDSADTRSRTDIITDAFKELETVTTDTIVEYATEHGVDEEFVRDYLTKLRDQGEVTQRGGELRRL